MSAETTAPFGGAAVLDGIAAVTSLNERRNAALAEIAAVGAELPEAHGRLLRDLAAYDARIAQQERALNDAKSGLSDMRAAVAKLVGYELPESERALVLDDLPAVTARPGVYAHVPDADGGEAGRPAPDRPTDTVHDPRMLRGGE